MLNAHKNHGYSTSLTGKHISYTKLSPRLYPKYPTISSTMQQLQIEQQHIRLFPGSNDANIITDSRPINKLNLQAILKYKSKMKMLNRSTWKRRCCTESHTYTLQRCKHIFFWNLLVFLWRWQKVIKTTKYMTRWSKNEREKEREKTYYPIYKMLPLHLVHCHTGVSNFIQTQRHTWVSLTFWVNVQTTNTQNENLQIHQCSGGGEWEKEAENKKWREC